jgi:tryptophan-rich sensory protein
MEELKTKNLGPAAASWGAAVAGVAVAGGVATDPESEWYRKLDRPSWEPPAGVFGPVWTVLYVLLAGSAALAFRDVNGPRRRWVLGLYTANLAMNLGWNVLFFRAHSPRAAAVDNVGLLGSIVALIVLVRNHNKIAAGALVPYAAWVAFASALSIAIAVKN